MAEIIENAMRKHIRSCIDQDVDALIVGDMGILSVARDLSSDVQLIASTYFATMNYSAVNFLRKLGVSRVILERHLTISEISEIIRHCKMEVEVFIHGEGCSNVNGKCYLFHFDYPALTQARFRVKGGGEPCTLPFEVYDTSDEKTMIDNIPILDAFMYCSLCKLQELIRTGVVGLKIAGRGGTIAYQESITKLYRELIDLIMSDQTKAFWEKVESLKRTFTPLPIGLQTIQDVACEKKRCLYPPLFHAPYKLPESWRAWTKLQFSSIEVIE